MFFPLCLFYICFPLLAASVVPINDIRGLEGMGYTKAEKALRCKLAAAYRLVDMYGLSQSIYNHITVRISQDTEHFLLNPFGKKEGDEWDQIKDCFGCCT